MSSRPIAGPASVITNGSMAASLTSLPTIIQNLSMISYDIAWSAGSSPVGAITIQVSNTYRAGNGAQPAVAGNWTTLTLSAATNISGNSGNGFIDVDATGAYAMRLVYTRTSGSGTLNVTVASKVA